MDGDEPPFASMPRIIGGRYGLASKEVTPSMLKPVFDEHCQSIGAIAIDQQLCTGCGICAEICNRQAILFDPIPAEVPA